MKLSKLEGSAVRASGEVDRATSLSDRELRTVAAMDGSVPPEICAIHDYYICDVLE